MSGPVRSGSAPTTQTGEIDVATGRRRANSRHRTSRRWPVPPWLAWVLRTGGPLLSLVPAVVAVGLVQSASPAGAATPAGAARFTVAGSWLVLRDGALAGYTHWTDAPPFGWLQYGLLNRALLGGDAQTVLSASRGCLVLITCAATALAWLVARRVGASGLAAGVAATVFGIVPVAVVVHAAPVPANLAVPWLLAALALALTRRAPLVTGVLAGVAAGVAALTLPVCALAVPLLALVALGRGSERNAEARKRRVRAGLLLAGAGAVAAVGCLLALVLGGLPAGSGARALNQVGAAAAQQAEVPAIGVEPFVSWLTADPLSLVVVLVALVLTARHVRDRPLVGAVLLALLLGLWPFGRDLQAPVALSLALVVPVLALTVDRGVVALGRPQFLPSLAGSSWLMALATLLVVAAVAWTVSLRAPAAVRADGPSAQAARWIRESVPAGQTVLVDLAAWPDLVGRVEAHVGWYAAARDGRAVATSAPWSDVDYVVAAGGLEGRASGAAGAALARSQRIVTYGSGTAALEVRAVERRQQAPPAQESATERRARVFRVSAGTQLARNQRVLMSGEDRALLIRGAVDPRISVVLGQLVVNHTITITGFPAGTGDAAGVRRRVVIGALDDSPMVRDRAKTSEVIEYFTALRGGFATQQLGEAKDAVVATFSADSTLVPSS